MRFLGFNITKPTKIRPKHSAEVQARGKSPQLDAIFAILRRMRNELQTHTAQIGDNRRDINRIERRTAPSRAKSSGLPQGLEAILKGESTTFDINAKDESLTEV